MTSETQPALNGVPLRDQELVFPITPVQAVAANRSQRERLVASLAELSATDWAAPSRCADWSVQNVVQHLVDINRVQRSAVAAALAGERFTLFQTFNPKVTPAEWIAEAGPQSYQETLSDMVETTQALLADVDALPADPDSVLLSTPAGRQPWHRSVLHALFDSAIHERDIFAPLGRHVDTPTDEFTPIAAYQLLLTGRVLAAVGIAVDLGLALAGGPSLRLVVNGPLVSVTEEAVDGGLTGEAAAVLDAMGGRGELADVVSGPAEVIPALGALRSLL